MTISDIELEAGLRDLRARTDHLAPLPADLAQRTRERYRAQRRARTAMAAGGLLALVLFVGVPAVVSDYVAEQQRGQTATPSNDTVTPAATTGLYALPTRGDLADEEEWLAAVTELDWGPVDTSSFPAGMEVPDPSVGSRRVAFAGDVASGRVALVLGMDGRNLAFAWFVGPEGAEPDEMALATMPGHVGSPLDYLALVDAPSPTAPEQSLVVVAMPGDTMTWKGPSSVSASGEVEEQTIPLALDDGIGSHEVSVPWSWEVDVRGPNDQRRGGSLADSNRSRPEGLAPGSPAAVTLADPRGLAAMTARENAEFLAASMLDEYAIGAADAQPTLLAAGPLGTRGQYGELYGMTHPSGATEVWLTTYMPSRTESGFEISRFPPAPVGQALMDRVIAVSAVAGLLVSAPDGVEAQVLDRSGLVLTTIPLTQGAGTGPMSDPAASKVRILDAAGDLVAEAPITVRR